MVVVYSSEIKKIYSSSRLVYSNIFGKFYVSDVYESMVFVSSRSKKPDRRLDHLVNLRTCLCCISHRITYFVFDYINIPNILFEVYKSNFKKVGRINQRIDLENDDGKNKLFDFLFKKGLFSELEKEISKLIDEF
jgi:hypothetical protein